MPERLMTAVRGVLLRHPQFSHRLDILLRPIEAFIKKPIFGCQMCGQCVLHSTGLVCPMTCPKNLRNGPCGGVRKGGNCEVYPEKACVWVTAQRRSLRLPWPDELHDLRPPVDWSIQGSASWVNLMTGRDQIRSGCQNEPDSALPMVKRYGG